LEEFINLLSIPNVASDRENIRKNALLIIEMMQRHGLNSKLLESKNPDGPPAVYAEYSVPEATHTLIFYAHYDGQPTDPRQWNGQTPSQPVLRNAPLESGGKIIPVPKKSEAIDPEWRLYGRSTSDDKAGVMAILTAFDSLM